jgi:hypothetical protein
MVVTVGGGLIFFLSNRMMGLVECTSFGQGITVWAQRHA